MGHVAYVAGLPLQTVLRDGLLISHGIQDLEGVSQLPTVILASLILEA